MLRPLRALVVAVAAAAGARRTDSAVDRFNHDNLAADVLWLDDGSLVVNELAPRVHNSGHWTIEGAVTSQFEQHIRAICGLPLGSPVLTGRAVTMDNLIGDDVNRWPELVAEPRAHVHIYGKGDARPGRKMGHVTKIILSGTGRGTAER